MTILWVFAISCGASLALTPLVRNLAFRWGLVDKPDGLRKLHAKPIPVAGGLIILPAAILGFLAALLLDPSFREVAAEKSIFFVSVLCSSVAICVLGILDDATNLRGRHKLLGQILAIAFLLPTGLIIERVEIFQWSIELGPMAIPFTVFWLLGAINSLNLIDGMDGLLSTVGLITCMALAAMSLLLNQSGLPILALALAGALLGFLRYNFPPASIFLGDGGSMLIGLLIGVLAIHGSFKGPATIALALPLAVLAVPILDSSVAIVRRKLTGRSLYASDRGHLHHCLLRHGFSTRKALLVVALVTTATVSGGILSLAFKNELIALAATLLTLGILIITKLFGYAEMVLVNKYLAATAASFLQIKSTGPARRIEIRWHGVASWEELFQQITETAEERGLQKVCLDINAPALQERYHARWDCVFQSVEVPDLWQVQVPLCLRGQVVGRLEMAGQRGGMSVGENLEQLSAWVDDVQEAIYSQLCWAPHAATDLAGPALVKIGAGRVAEAPLRL